MSTSSSARRPHSPARTMAEIGYLLGRLPPITAEDAYLVIDPEEFAGLILDQRIRFWASGVLDWLRIANWQSVQRKLPAPFPDVAATPELTWSGDPWAAYFARFASISAPAVVRDWTMQDMALIAARAASGGRTLGFVRGGQLSPRVENLLAAPAVALAPATARDVKLLNAGFDWLDDRMFCTDPDSADRVYVYALKLMLLVRHGRRLEHSEVA